MSEMVSEDGDGVVEVGESVEVVELVDDDGEVLGTVVDDVIVVTGEDGTLVDETVDIYDADGNLVAEDETVDLYDADANLVAEVETTVVVEE
jgi:hypothetical protein